MHYLDFIYTDLVVYAKQLLSAWIFIVQSKNLRELLQIYFAEGVRFLLHEFFFSF